MYKFLIFALFLATASACADTGKLGDGGQVQKDLKVGTEGGVIVDSGVSPDGLNFGKAVVYAHTADKLYQVDPETLQITEIGPFTWPGDADRMTDLAVDRTGKIIGISKQTVYEVDPNTAACKTLATAKRYFVGLSFVQQAGNKEFLMGIDKSGGDVYSVDPLTGSSTLIGNFGGGLLASGDVVSVKGFGTVATVVKGSQAPTDHLARIDEKTGKATLIGDTGYSKIWGLGFWKNKLYGFTEKAEFVTIDVNTGAAQLVQQGGGAWWGAGVTTSAPVIN